MPTVLLARHGQASFGGANYDALSDLGRRQAAVLAEALRRRGVEPSVVASGTLSRQRETAAAFSDGAERLVDERWDEYDANEILTHHGGTELRVDGAGSGEQGGTLDLRRFQAALDRALTGWVEAGEDSPCARSWPRFASAGGEALADLAGRLGRGETAIVLTSGGAIAALVADLLGAPEAAFVALNRGQVNAAVTKLAIGRSGTSLLTFNDHSHLEEVGAELITYR